VPCNTILRSKIEFLPTSTDIRLLTEALRALSFTDIVQVGELFFFRTRQGAANYNTATGKLVLPNSLDVNVIKRAYSEQIVQSQAARHGWKTAWSTNSEGRRQVIVQRRG
jgi:hypothetical protein